MSENKVVGKECKFAIHIPSKNRETPDVHLIKETLHHEDGTTTPNLRFIKNFKRPFWVTKPTKRNHKDKKEWELMENLNKFEVTESDLRYQVAQALGKGWSNDHLKKLAESPYIYGIDISSTSIIKRSYQDKYPNCLSEYSVCTLDVETDVLHGTGEVIMANVCFKNKIHFVVLKKFVTGISKAEDYFRTACQKYIGSYIETNGLEISYTEADTIGEMLKILFAKVHQWMPDFLAIWNVDFDIVKILEMLEREGIDPKDVLCDPSVPKNLRICKYKQGPKKKTTASGKVIPINPAAQWHTLMLTASFYVIDAMCSFKHIRLGQQEKSSYSLDAILSEYLGIRKLKFKEADSYSGLAWHQFMQTNFKIEYMVYNIFDSYSMLELDKELKDLCFTLPSYAASSDFWNFKSQPKRIVDELHFRILDKGHVIAALSSPQQNQNTGAGDDDDDVVEEDEDDVLGLDGWILTLAAHMSVLGMQVILEDPSIRTNIRTHTFDSDMVSAYPSCISCANVSKETTHRELITIEGVPEEVFRMQNLNMILGAPNAIEYSTAMFCMPQPGELLAAFQAQA